MFAATVKLKPHDTWQGLSIQRHLNTLRIFEKSSVQTRRPSAAKECANALLDSIAMSAELRAIATHTEESFPGIDFSAGSSKTVQLRFRLCARSAITGRRSRFRFEILNTSNPLGASFER